MRKSIHMSSPSASLPSYGGRRMRYQRSATQQRELDEQIANAEQGAATRRALHATTRAEARDMLSMWMEDDQTVEEQRATRDRD